MSRQDAGFVPLERLVGRAAEPRPVDQRMLDSLSAHLGDFTAGLDDREREALAALLESAACRSPVEVLAAQPACDVLDNEELLVMNEVLCEPAVRWSGQSHGSRPVLTVVMKATRLCNLRCTYCHFWKDGPNQTMSFEVLARATRDALEIPSARAVEFVWHGGETTLLPLAYYRKALWLQQLFRRPDQKVTNSLQTNGTRFDEAWLRFCQDYGLAVGVSLDGPPEIHDRRRTDAAGRPTSERARKTLENVRASGLENGVLMVVDEEVLRLGAERLLNYFLEIGVENVGLLNVIPENTSQAEAARGPYVSWRNFVTFLQDLFRCWWPNHVDRIEFREISDLLEKVRGNRGETCFFVGDCMGSFLTVEPTGEVSACDKYVGDPDYHFGNLLENRLSNLLDAAPLARIRAETAAAVDRTRSCPWFDVCQGACPHDRYLRVRRSVTHDESCCGLRPLLADMAEALCAISTTASARHEGASE
jgi:uncharacterized protein